MTLAWCRDRRRPRSLDRTSAFAEHSVQMRSVRTLTDERLTDLGQKRGGQRGTGHAGRIIRGAISLEAPRTPEPFRSGSSGEARSRSYPLSCQNASRPTWRSILPDIGLTRWIELRPSNTRSVPGFMAMV